eukprot:gene23966-24022_t
MSSAEAASALVDSALKRGSTDNCSAIVVDLSPDRADLAKRMSSSSSYAAQRASRQMSLSVNTRFPPINQSQPQQQQRNNPFTQGYGGGGGAGAGGNAGGAPPPPPPGKGFSLSQSASQRNRNGSSSRS